jgi:acyl carrier protein
VPKGWKNSLFNSIIFNKRGLSMADIKEIKKEVKKLVSEISEIPEAEINDNAMFAEDLGLDSMMALEIVASVEKKYKIVIPEEKIPTIRSLNDIYKIVEENFSK